MSDHMDERVAPKREDRLGSCTAFDGSACRLKKEWAGGCLRGNERAFCQTSICQLIPGAAIVNTIPDSVVIVHGSVGCGSTAHLYNASTRGRQMADGSANPKGTLWLSTNLTEADVVNGGESKLEETILEADKRYRPAAIFVLASCVPGIIGDDIDGLAAKLQPLVSGIILPIHCEGFKTTVMATAYDSIYHAVARHLVEGPERDDYGVVDPEPAEAQERIRRSRRVNLMNVSSMGDDDEVELSRLLASIGLEVRILPCFAHPHDFVCATEAALSISTCPTHDDYLLEFLKQRWGVPYVLRHMPIGIEATNRWIRDVAEVLGLQDAAEKFIESQVAELEEALAPIKEEINGKRAVLSAGEVRTIATAGLLQELGMEVAAIRPYHFDEFGGPTVDILRDQETVEVDVATVQPFEAANIIERTKPDIYIGHVADVGWAAKLGVPTLPIYGGPNVYVGYAGAFDIARRIKRVLRNASFNRNLARHVRQPYDSAWYEEDTARFIRSAGDSDPAAS